MNKGMSKDMFYFIKENMDILGYDLDKGIIITPRGTNGTVCSSTGYLRVKLRGKTLQVHQILAVKYFGDKCLGKQVNHIDGNKTNNMKGNLEMVSRAENIKHQWENNLSYERVGTAKLTDDEVREIRKRYVYGSRGKNGANNLAKEYGVDRTNILRIVKREAYKDVD